MQGHTCPACGNRDRSQMTDNNLPAGHPDYTRLCLAQTGPCGDPPADNPTDQTCGMQWSPHAFN